MSTPLPCYVGVDVAKAHLDLAVQPTGETAPFTHDEAGLTTLIAYLRPRAPTLIVLEATGGYEADVAAMRKLLTILNAIVKTQRPWASLPLDN